MFIPLVVYIFLNVGSDLVLYVLELVVSSYKFYSSGNAGMSIY
jgi:hypothetical protein